MRKKRKLPSPLQRNDSVTALRAERNPACWGPRSVAGGSGMETKATNDSQLCLSVHFTQCLPENGMDRRVAHLGSCQGRKSVIYDFICGHHTIGSDAIVLSRKRQRAPPLEVANVVIRV